MSIKKLLNLFVLSACLGIGQASAQTYCTPTGLYDGAGDYIDAFSTSGGSTNISNTGSGYNSNTDAYIFYNTMTHTGVQGTNFSFSGTVGSYSSSEHVAIWVDWNHDGDFDDANENIYNSSGLTGAYAPFSGSFTIPINATPGVTRMRVMDTYSSLPSPCNTVPAYDGETEDYNFTILASTPCSGAPTAGTATSSAANICSGSSITLNLTGSTVASGITYKWQSSPSATGPWTDISTPSSSSGYTTTIASTLYYRAAVACNGGTPVYSTAVQVTVPALFPGGTYTIRPSQPASSTNFQTFAAAISAISCGTSGPVVFNVDSATYNEQVLVPQINTNSATNTITFNGNGATLTFAGTSAAPYTLCLNGADYFRFNKLNIVATSTSYGLAVHLWNNADRNIFTNCNISVPATATSSSISPFSISGSATSATTAGTSGNYNTLTGCTITGGYYNTVIYGSTATPAMGNRIVSCTLKDYYTYGLYSYYTDSTLIASNDINRLTRASVSTFYGIYCYYATRALVEKNRIHDPFGANEANSSYYSYCLYMTNNTAMTSNQANTVVNNLIYNIRTNYYIYGMYLNYGYINVYHNTVSLDQTTSTGTTTAYNLYAYDYLNYGAGIFIKNNILSNTRGGTGTKYLMYFSSTSAINSDFNDLYMNAAAGTSNYVGYYNGGYTTLAAWQGANGGIWDANSVNADPMYTSIAGANLKPTNPNIDNRGTPLGVVTDISGTPRLSPPDVGAYEFGPGCLPVGTVSVNNVTTTTASVKWTSTVGNSGYEYLIDRIPTDPSAAGTLITDTSYNATNLRPYTTYYAHVRVKCANGGFSSWTTTPFTTVCVTPTAAISSTGTTICPNQPIAVRTGGADNLTYQWQLNGSPISNATDSVYATSTGGTYSVIVHMGTCTKTSDTVALTVDTSLLAHVTYAGSNHICGGGSILMTVNSGAGYTYEWRKNGAPIPTATNSTYTVEYTGVYTVKITAPGHGCAAISDPIPVTVNDNPYPQIARNGSSLSTTHAFATYQWYYGVQPISGATAATYNFTHDGSYTVVVTDSNGCTGTSSRYMVNFLGISNVQASDISIYPNPATNAVTIAAPVAVNAEIRTIDGKTVMQVSKATTIDIHNLSAGMYLLYVMDQDKQVLKVEKLIKSSH